MWPFKRKRTAEGPPKPRRVSVRELEDRRRQATAESYRPSLLRRAVQLGVELPYPEGMDIWYLMDKVHEAQDRLDWPALEERARRLGIDPDSYGFKNRTRLSLDCYAEEDRRRLLPRYGREGEV